jgi:lysophospholipase L1-like esterase
VNGGINGSVSGVVFEAYRAEWASPAPRLCVVVLGNNDREADAFRANLADLVAFNAERRTATVFVLEPNSIQGQSPELIANHAILREVGARTATPVIDMPALLAPREDDGFLWWDAVHLTSGGHARFAELLHGELQRLGLP